VYSIWRGAGKFQWPRKYDIQKGLRAQYVPRIPVVPLPDLEDLNLNPEAMRQKVTHVAVPALGVMLLVPLAIVDSPGHHQKGAGSTGLPIGNISQLIHSKVVSQKSNSSSKQSTPVAASSSRTSATSQASQLGSSALSPLSSVGSTVNNVIGSTPIIGGMGGGEVTAPLPDIKPIISTQPTPTPIPTPTPLPTVPAPSLPIPSVSAGGQVNTPLTSASAGVSTSPLSASASVGPVSVGL
jgi:hypothetical protein